MKVIAQTVQAAGSPVWSFFAQIGSPPALTSAFSPRLPHFSRSPQHLCLLPCKAGGIGRNILTFPACLHLLVAFCSPCFLSVLQSEKNKCVRCGLRPFFNRSPPEGEKASTCFLPGLCPASVYHPASWWGGGTQQKLAKSGSLPTFHRLAIQFQFRFVSLFICLCNEGKASF